MDDVGKVLLAQQAHGTTEHPADKERGAKDAARAAAGDRAARGEDFEQGEGEEGADCELAVEPPLDDTEPIAQHLRVDKGRQPHQQAPAADDPVAGQWQAVEEGARKAQGLDVKNAD